MTTTTTHNYKEIEYKVTANKGGSFTATCEINGSTITSSTSTKSLVKTMIKKRIAKKLEK